MKKIYESPYIVACDDLRRNLDASGIGSELRNEFGNPIGLAAMGGVCSFSAPEVWVDDSDYEQARSFVAEWEANYWKRSPASRDAGQPGWVCPVCGESNDAQFGSCWKCDARRE